MAQSQPYGTSFEEPHGETRATIPDQAQPEMYGVTIRSDASIIHFLFSLLSFVPYSLPDSANKVHLQRAEKYDLSLYSSYPS